MNLPKSIFKSNRVIGLDSDAKKVKLVVLASSGKLQ